MSSQGSENTVACRGKDDINEAQTAQAQDYRFTRTQQDRFTTLPNELLVEIIERLPARDICRLRVQNHHLRQFVDSSQTRLTKDVIEYHRARIIRDFQYLTDFTGLQLFDALMRYVYYYGTPDVHFPGPTEDPRYVKRLHAPALSAYWLRHMASLGCAGSRREFSLLFTKICNIAQFQREGWHRLVIRSLYRKFFRWYDAHRLPGDLQSHEQLAEKVQFATSGVVRPVRGKPPRHFLLEELPLFSSTHYYCGTMYDYSTDIANLRRALDLPELILGGTLAYCTDKDEVAQLIRTMGQGPVGMLKMAVIVEGIYLW